MTTLTQKNRELRIINDAIILAEAEHEPFCDVEVITLNAHKRDLATDIALTFNPSLLWINQRIDKIAENVEAQEFIEVLEDKIRVCLDVDHVDGRSLNRTFSLLMKMSEFPVGKRILVADLEKGEANFVC